jgi:YidC/Oxa1 family membrane protein insertase
MYYAAVTAVAVAIAFLLTPQAPIKRNATKNKAVGDKTQIQAPKPSQLRASRQEGTAADKRRVFERTLTASQRLTQEKVETIQSGSFEAAVSNLNGGLKSYQLRGGRYRTKQGRPIDLVTTDKEDYLPLAIELYDAEAGVPAIDPDAFWRIEKLSEQALRLSWQGRGISVARKLEAGKNPYELWVTTTVANVGGQPRSFVFRIGTHHYVARQSEKAAIPFLPVVTPARSQGLCRYGELVQGEPRRPDYQLGRFDGKKLLEPHSFKGLIAFAGVENVYFLTAIAPDPRPGQALAEGCTLQSSDRGKDRSGDPVGTLFRTQILFPKRTFDPGNSQTYRVLAYLGPKTPEDLAKAGHTLKKAVDLGFFAILSEGLTWLLRVFHQASFGNWGIAIILLTFCVKIALYPLTATSYRSMARMRALKPEMDRVNEMYKEDREKRGAAVMELYRKNKINPMGGCLPQLLQLPIWIALYTSLSTEIELFRAPFCLWWRDLSAPDPYYVLPLALGVLMYAQQKMTPSTMDEMQTKMMLYMMPVMMTSFMLFLPAGLCLYILTNSMLSIGQQKLVERQFGRASAPQAAASAIGTAKENEGDSAASALNNQTPNIVRVESEQAERRSRRGRKK